MGYLTGVPAEMGLNMSVFCTASIAKKERNTFAAVFTKIFLVSKPKNPNDLFFAQKRKAKASTFYTVSF